jgi:glutamine cyclotransferase
LPSQIEEGWGITNNSSELIISDGTEKLFFIDPLDPEFKVKRVIQVKESKDNKIFTNLNELEYAYDYIFANIWFSNSILVIDPNTGEVIR